MRTEDAGQGFYRLTVRTGFLETPDVPALLARAIKEASLPFSVDEVTYYLGRETFVSGERGRMGPWSESLFAFLSRNAHSAPMYFGVPPERVVELGAQIDL
ncbi:MAG: hypothetical protein WCJ30_07410 [Deltaproteobacteria bacterium]